MALTLLSPLASLIQIALVPISPTFYPYPLATTLHAARISMAYRGRVESMGLKGKASRGVEWAGFLIMCWGGSFLTSILQGLPPPQLLSPHPFINYLSTHLLLSLLLPTLPSPSTLDTLLPLFDALMRTMPITGAVLSVTSHSSAAIKSSLWAQLVLGGLASSGGGIMAGTFNIFSPEWKFSTPPILNAGFWGSMDFWAGSLGATIFGLLTSSHPSYTPVLLFLSPPQEGSAPAGPLMTTLGARSVVVLVLTGLFASRAWVMHWSGVKGGEVRKQVKAAKGAAVAGVAPVAEGRKKQ